MSALEPHLLIGVGNGFRRDDAAGLEVARRVRRAGLPQVAVLERDGDPASLIDAWSTADAVVVVDAVSSGSPPGTLHRFKVGDAALPASFARPSTHAFGIAEAVELGRALGRLPDRLTVHGIEGEDFGLGEGLTDSVARAVGRLNAEIRDELSAVGDPR